MTREVPDLQLDVPVLCTYPLVLIPLGNMLVYGVVASKSIVSSRKVFKAVPQLVECMHPA